MNWKKKKESIVDGLDNLNKEKLLSDKKISEESLIPWKCIILTKIDKNISKLKNRIKSSKFSPIRKQIDIISCLKAPQNMFVLVPIDKHVCPCSY